MHLDAAGMEGQCILQAVFPVGEHMQIDFNAIEALQHIAWVAPVIDALAPDVEQGIARRSTQTKQAAQATAQGKAAGQSLARTAAAIAAPTLRFAEEMRDADPDLKSGV